MTSLDATALAMGSGDVVRPLHNGYGFSSIPATIRGLLTAGRSAMGEGLAPDVMGNVPDRADQVILVLVDGMGWNQLARAQSRGAALREFFATGCVSRLTAQFPSTTAAHVTSLMSGEPVGRHGLYEWYVHEPAIDDVLETFLFSRARLKRAETLREEGVDPRAVYRFPRFADRLRSEGVETHIYQPGRFSGSTYNKYACAGADLFPWFTHAECVVELGRRVREIRAAGRRAWHYVYFPEYDSLVHHHGTSSESAFIMLEQIIRLIHEHVAMPLGSGGASDGDVVMMVTADHGAVDVDRSRVRYLNQIMPEIERDFRVGRSGKAIVPVGMYRDMMLFVRDERLEAVEAALTRELNGLARVRRVADLLRDGWFGESPSRSLLDRLGNLVILPSPGCAVWWYVKGVFEVWNLADHGGVSPDEMFIPFWVDSFRP